MAVATWGAVWAHPLCSSSGNGADGAARGAGEELCSRKGGLPAGMRRSFALRGHMTALTLPDQQIGLSGDSCRGWLNK